MTVRHVSLSQFGRVLTRMDAKLRRALVLGLRSGAMRYQILVTEEIDHALPHPAVDTGGLRQSVEYQRVEDGAVVAVTAPHAGPIDQGTRPFFPPLAPLTAWVLRKGLESDPVRARGRAYAIAKTIAKRGIAPRNFMGKAWDRFPPVLAQEIRAALTRAADEPPPTR